MSIHIADKATTRLRFPIGTRVECNVGPIYAGGTVTKHFYEQKSFPAGMCAPYQVRLDSGKLVFAPADADRVIRKERAHDAAPEGTTSDTPRFAIGEQVEVRVSADSVLGDIDMISVLNCEGGQVRLAGLGC